LKEELLKILNETLESANMNKISKKWSEAGGDFVKSADYNLKLNDKFEAAVNYVNAASCYKHCDISECINCYKLAIEISNKNGRISFAAKCHKEIAEIYEKGNKLEECIKHFQEAGDFYSMENLRSNANECFLKVAHVSAQLEKYPQAIQQFEDVAQNSLGNSLLKWSAKGYLLKAGLCYLATKDMNAVREALTKYKTMDSAFSSSTDCQFLNNLADDYEKMDINAFTNIITEFDRIIPLDNWNNSILLVIIA